MHHLGWLTAEAVADPEVWRCSCVSLLAEQSEVWDRF